MVPATTPSLFFPITPSLHRSPGLREDFLNHGAVHVGIATQAPAGLLVPVLRHAQALDLWAAAAEIARLADLARSGKIARDELSGSTITITSLGRLGGLSTTPVINAPETAIVAVNRILDRASAESGGTEPDTGALWAAAREQSRPEFRGLG